MGLIGGLSLVMMAMMKNQTKGNLKAQTDSDILSAVNEMNSLLFDPAKCLLSLGGKNAKSDTTITQLVWATGINKFATNTPFANNENITSYALNATTTEVANNISTLTVNFAKKAMLGIGSISKKINLYVEVDASSKITACRSSSSSAALTQMCADLGGTYNPAATPKCSAMGGGSSNSIDWY